MKRVVVALLGAPFLALATPLTTAAFAPQTDAAVRALHWLHTQQTASGSIAGDPSNTEYTIWGLAANGFSTSAFTTAGKSPLDDLAANVATEEKTAGSIAQLLLAVRAAGVPVTAFGGHNLVTDLNATYNQATGEFGSNDLFGDALSVLALTAAGQSVPSNAVGFLTAHQCTDGGWVFDDTFPCPTPQDLSDTNTTSTALMALSATGQLDAAARTRALAFLKTQQQSSGGFDFEGSSPPSDPDSDGLVIQALLTVGEDPTGPAWSVPTGNHNAVADLVSFQGCDGAFSFPGVGPDNLLGTTQPLIALASRHLPLTPSESGANVLTASAPTPANCATPTPAPTPTPTAHPSPTPRPAASPASSPATLAPTGGSRAPLGLLLLGVLLIVGGLLRLRRA